MIRLFSSDLATALANLVVFLTLCWGAFNLLGPKFKRVLQRLSSRSRQTRIREILSELRKLRSFRENSYLLYYEIIEKTMRRLIASMIATTIVIMIFVIIIQADSTPKWIGVARSGSEGASRV